MYKFDIIIKKLRVESKLTQKELARAIGVSQQTVSLWESRSAVPDALTIIAICKYFNVSSDHLLGIEAANKRHYVKKIKTDCEFGGPKFNTSEISQVRSILDFLREQKGSEINHFFFIRNFLVLLSLVQKSFHLLTQFALNNDLRIFLFALYYNFLKNK